MKKVSIIVPAYKCADFIEKNLNALLAQTYQNKEIIVVNDGSPDNLAEVLSRYKDRIRIIEKENGGASSARNKGLDAADGEFIAFIDSDDRIEPDTIERGIAFMEESGADVLRYNVWREYPDGHLIEHFRLFDNKTVVEKSEFKEKIYIPMMEGIRFNLTHGIYRRSVIGDTRFREDLKTCEDAVFNAEIFTKAKRFAFDPDIVYYYYQSGTGLTGSGLSVKEKYICNYKFGKVMESYLPQWGMNTLYYRLKIYKRLINITISKLTRKK